MPFLLTSKLGATGSGNFRIWPGGATGYGQFAKSGGIFITGDFTDVLPQCLFFLGSRLKQLIGDVGSADIEQINGFMMLAIV